MGGVHSKFGAACQPQSATLKGGDERRQILACFAGQRRFKAARNENRFPGLPAPTGLNARPGKDISFARFCTPNAFVRPNIESATVGAILAVVLLRRIEPQRAQARSLLPIDEHE